MTIPETPNLANNSTIKNENVNNDQRATGYCTFGEHKVNDAKKQKKSFNE